jgi:hypothetical protein
MRFRTAALRFLPLGVGISAVAAGPASAAFFAAHRFFSAADSRLRPAGVIPPLRFAGALTGKAGRVPSMPRNAVSARSMAVFCRSSCLMTPFKLSVIR